jgi:hypothetical protein
MCCRREDFFVRWQRPIRWPFAQRQASARNTIARRRRPTANLGCLEIEPVGWLRMDVKNCLLRIVAESNSSAFARLVYICSGLDKIGSA